VTTALAKRPADILPLIAITGDTRHASMGQMTVTLLQDLLSIRITRPDQPDVTLTLTTPQARLLGRTLLKLSPARRRSRRTPS